MPSRLTVFQDNVWHEAKVSLCLTHKQIIHTSSPLRTWPKKCLASFTCVCDIYCVAFTLFFGCGCLFLILPCRLVFPFRHLGTRRRPTTTTPVALANSSRWTTKRAALWEGMRPETNALCFRKKKRSGFQVNHFVVLFSERMLRNISWRSQGWSIRSTMSGEHRSQSSL